MSRCSSTPGRSSSDAGTRHSSYLRCSKCWRRLAGAPADSRRAATAKNSSVSHRKYQEYLSRTSSGSRWGGLAQSESQPLRETARTPLGTRRRMNDQRTKPLASLRGRSLGRSTAGLGLLAAPIAHGSHRRDSGGHLYRLRKRATYEGSREPPMTATDSTEGGTKGSAIDSVWRIRA